MKAERVVMELFKDTRCTGEKGIGVAENPCTTKDQAFTESSLDLEYTGPCILPMPNARKHTNGPHFFICTSKTPWLNGKHVVFGKVVDGYNEWFRRWKKWGSHYGETSSVVVIQDCGQITEN